MNNTIKEKAEQYANSVFPKNGSYIKGHMKRSVIEGYTICTKDVEGLIEARIAQLNRIGDNAYAQHRINELTDLLTQIQNLKK